ncbi:hypothetical protein ACFWJM_11935, partial [Streptomyces sp. NPDC127077]|uniref:hypothetical protein n=1 Tax=Streptomyces sp. NPDC127077 TaxID=3347131 RepID=UPI00366967F7
AALARCIECELRKRNSEFPRKRGNEFRKRNSESECNSRKRELRAPAQARSPKAGSKRVHHVSRLCSDWESQVIP